MTDEPRTTDGNPEPPTPEPTHLSPDIQGDLRESLEARGFTVEFRPGYVLATKDGKTDRIRNATVLQYIRAFNPKPDSID